MNKSTGAKPNSKNHDLNKALDHYQRSLEIGDRKGVADAYNQVGVIYQNPDFKKSSLSTALTNYEKGLEINLEIGDKEGIASSYYHIGTIYQDKYFFLAPPNKLETALDCHQKSLEIYLEIDNKKGVARSYYHIGLVYNEKKEYNTALVNYFQAYVGFKELAIKNFTKGSIMLIQRELGREKFLDHASQVLAKLSSSLQEKINLNDFLELPRKSAKTYKRNDKVKVRYQDGIEKEGKYKSFEREIKNGKCLLI